MASPYPPKVLKSPQPLPLREAGGHPECIGGVYCDCVNLSRKFRRLSAQNDNVLIAQSRNVLLTGSGWGGGIRNTSHDPTGPRSADRSEESQEGADHAASSRPGDRTNRTTYPPIAGKAEKGGRPGGRPRSQGKTIQPQAGGEEPGQGGGDSGTRKVSRVRSHAGQRVSEQASPDHGQPRNGKGVDDRRAALAVSETESGEGPPVAPEAVALRRTGAVGYQRAPMAGRGRAEAVSDQHDRRCHQPAACALLCFTTRPRRTCVCSGVIWSAMDVRSASTPT